MKTVPANEVQHELPAIGLHNPQLRRSSGMPGARRDVGVSRDAGIKKDKHRHGHSHKEKKHKSHREHKHKKSHKEVLWLG